MRIYQLYPTGVGRFTSLSRAYNGVAYNVCATSVKQAYYLAYQGRWSGGPHSLTGIVSIYRRDGGHQTWDGCVGHSFHIQHGDGQRKIIDAMQAHYHSGSCAGGAA